MTWFAASSDRLLRHVRIRVRALGHELREVRVAAGERQHVGVLREEVRVRLLELPRIHPEKTGKARDIGAAVPGHAGHGAPRATS
jgi:hypothetical protein